MLTKYEVARVVGMRALHLSEGATPCVEVVDEHLRSNMLYVAALELSVGKLDALVRREDGSLVRTLDVNVSCGPLRLFLDLCDDGSRSYAKA